MISEPEFVAPVVLDTGDLAVGHSQVSIAPNTNTNGRISGQVVDQLRTALDRIGVTASHGLSTDCILDVADIGVIVA